MKIKVVHIITKLELGGAQQNTIFTCQNLDKTKFDVYLITGSGGILDRDVIKKNIRTFFVKSLLRELSPLSDIFAFSKIFLILKKLKPQIIHTHSSKAGILARWAGFFANVPIIIHTYHGFGFHNKQFFLLRKFFIFLEKITSYITTKLIAVSYENIKTALQLKIAKPNQFILIRSGIDIAKFSNKKINKNEKLKTITKDFENKKIILTVSNFKPQKNPLAFVEIAREVIKKNPGLKTLWLYIGDGELRKKVEDLINRYKLSDYIYLLGWREDVDELLSICDLFILHSYWEGLPRSVIEALASGKPVIAYKVDGVKEIIKDGLNGYLVDVDDIAGFAEKIISVLTNPQLYNELQKNTKLGLEEFNIFDMVSKQEQLYTTLLAKNESH